LEPVQRQAIAGLTVGTGVFIDPALIVEAEQSLNLPDNLSAGAGGFEDLIEEAEEGAAHIIDSLTAVGTFIGLGQELRGQPGSKELFQVSQAMLAEAVDAPAQGCEARA
jgi:hypothetical protein